MTHTTITQSEFSDTELVARSLAGDRDAFSRIVSRYPDLDLLAGLQAGLAISGRAKTSRRRLSLRRGSIFRLLREPEKLRSWLCGIVATGC